VNANYLVAQSTCKSMEAQLQRAKTNLEYATITAPISGVVISRNVNVGQTVAASFATPTLFTIVNDLSKMQLQAKVDEADIGLIKKGQPVTFTVDAYPDTLFTGIVQQLRLQPTTTQNVVTYSVMIDVPNPDLKLLPGMNANLSIQVETHKDVLSVPLAAIFFKPLPDMTTDKNDPGRITIWVKCNANDPEGQVFYGIRMKPMIVKKGLDNGSFIEVTGENISEKLSVVTGIKDVVVEKKKGLLGPPSKRPKNMQ
jgi:HlyD family secretion protein